MFSFALCVWLLFYLSTTTAVTLGDCSNILKSINYSSSREVGVIVGALVCVNTLFRTQEPVHKSWGITSPQAPTSPVQAGQEDSDFFVAHFLVPNSK